MKLSATQRCNLVLAILLAAGILFLIRIRLYGFKGFLDNPVYSLQINEVCTVNPGTDAGGSVTYEDYIELYNPTPYAVSLENLYLSDDVSKPHLAALPPDTIAPESYYVIYAVGSEGFAPEGCPFVPFRLAAKETVFLNSSSSVIDSVTIPSVDAGAVYARAGENADTFSQMRPSPGLSNDTASLLLEKPELSAESGFYEEDFFLEITVPENTSVYYTLDGSEPTRESLLYTEPIWISDPSPLENTYSARTDITSSFYVPPADPVDKAVVIRAAAIDTDGNYSDAVTASYFIGFKNKTGYKNAAVLSLVSDPAGLFDPESGIYVLGPDYVEGVLPEDFANYYRKGAQTEQGAHVDLFGRDHALSLSQECGIRIRGNESRNFPQKSFTLFSRKRYGSASFAPVLFDSQIAYPDVILNTGRSLKKVFFFSLVADRETAVQRYLPCQVFLNGEYWGMYYLMEKYSAEYLEGSYGVNSEDALLIKSTREVQDGRPSDISRFKSLRNYLEQDMTNPWLYEGLLQQMDMQSFIDWMCTNIYIGNTDSKPLGGNVFTWQTTLVSDAKYYDGKWRWMLYDLDDSLGTGIDIPGLSSYDIDSFVEHPGYSPCGFLDDAPMPSLMGNKDFRKQFVLTFMDMANENFNASRVSELLDKIEAEYTPWADKSFERWNTAVTDLTFSQQVKELRTFFNRRFDAIVPCLAEHFSLEGKLVTVFLSSKHPQGGTVKLNTITPDLSEGTWSGQYYTDYPVTLSASPLEGYTFAGWEISGAQILNGTSADAEITVSLQDGNAGIQAVFQKQN